MQIKKYQHLADTQLDMLFVTSKYWLEEDFGLAERYRRMWSVCRDRFDKEILLEVWDRSNNTENLAVSLEEYKSEFLKRATNIANLPRKPAPTWQDIRS